LISSAGFANPAGAAPWPLVVDWQIHDIRDAIFLFTKVKLKRQPYDMPPLTHSGKLDKFRQIFARERAIAAESTKLSGKLYPMRNRVLYPELRELFVIMPAAAVSERQVRRYLSQAKRFVNLLISQLGL